MDRRAFLTGCAGIAMYGIAARGGAVRAAVETGPSLLLSSQGCGRATGYAEANKIVTVDDRTHVAWLDSPPEGFRVRIRTLDRGSGEWSPVYTVGEAYDNHGGPALAVDSQGHLHVVYHPHHHPFRYRKSVRPNDASQWDDELQFGERCTYPTLVCGPEDTLYFTCRRSFSDRPWQVELWTKPPDQAWQGPRPILQARYPGYSHFQESLAWGPDHRSLHLACRFHENTDRAAYGRLQTVGYMVSHDFGVSWQRSDGSSIETPATADTIQVLARGGVDQQRLLRAGALAVDPDGLPRLIYSLQEDNEGQTILATPRAGGEWHRTVLNEALPEPWASWQLIMPGGVTFHARHAMTIVATLQNVTSADDSWGHASSEVVRFRTTAGADRFGFELVSKADPQRCHWLPNIERSTGFNHVPDRPAVLYTGGPPGEKNTDLLSNRVFYSE